MPDRATTSNPAQTEVSDETGEAVTFTLDGRPVTAHKGEMLISAAERAGTFIPRFCYHPRMKSVGVCRMCLVDVSGPRGSSLQPSCFVEVTEGSEVTTNSDKVKKAQDGILEFLLVNHPLDCPVCDKGGECPLQDQTLAHGPGESRFIEEKRHFEKPIPISDLVLLDRERCIQCSRCTRFAAEVAGEAQIDFIGRGEQLEVNIFPELPFSSYFSGNTVQICPVGALTAAPYRFLARPWDLGQVESTCTTCAVGCRIAVQSSSNRVTRLLGIDIDPVNHGWLCDKGRFAFDAVNRDDRLTEPMVRKDGTLVPVSWHEALDVVADGLRDAMAAGGGAGAVGVIGGGRLTNEGAYTWAKLAKGVLGTDSVDAQLGDGLPAEVVLSLPRATIDQAASADTVIVVAGDIREELPILFLRLRSAVVDGHLSVVEVSPQATSLTAHAAASLRYRPGDAATVVRSLVDTVVPVPDGIDIDTLAEARRVIGTGSVVVIVGRPSLAEDGALVADAVQVLAKALPDARFLPALRRGNVMGALDMGMSPGLLPGRVTLEAGREWFAQAWGSVPETRGRDTAGMLASAAGDDGASFGSPGTDLKRDSDSEGADALSNSARIRALVVLGADPLADFPDRRLARRGLDGAGFVVAVASSPGPVVDSADVVLPAAEAHERPGTTTNIEGRISRVGQMLVPPGHAWPDWMIAVELAARLGTDLHFDTVADVWDEIEELAPLYRGVTRAVLDAAGSTNGVVVPLTGTAVSIAQRPDTQSGGAPPLDPIAFPGVESVERQGAPTRVGMAEFPATANRTGGNGNRTGGNGNRNGMGAGTGAGARSDKANRDAGNGASPPPMVSGPVDLVVPHVPPTDSYSMRLVSGRRLYDLGVAVTGTPALVGLVNESLLRANPHDLDDLGVPTGGRVRVRTATASATLVAVADPALPRKVVAIDFNAPLPESTGAESTGAESTVGDLIDIDRPVTELRLETP